MARRRLQSGLNDLTHRFKLRQHRILASRVVGSRVLDVGYAQMPNRFLCQAERRVTGLDIAIPDREPLSYDEVIQGDVSNIRSLLSGREFDTIVLTSVIEHLETPYQALRDLKSLLADQGRLILTTPNPLGIPTVFFEIAWSRRYFYTREHVYYFLPRWVERMLTTVELDLREVLPVGFWILPIPCPRIMSYSLIYVSDNPPSHRTAESLQEGE